MADLADLYPNDVKAVQPPSYAETTGQPQSDGIPLSLFDSASSNGSNQLSYSQGSTNDPSQNSPNNASLYASQPNTQQQQQQHHHHHHHHQSRRKGNIKRVESHNYPEVTSQPTSAHSSDEHSSPHSSDTTSPTTSGDSTPPIPLSPSVVGTNLTPYQLLVSDLCYQPSFCGFCLACWCPHFVSGWNQMRIRESGSNCFYFGYGCLMLNCCCCWMSRDIQRRLGAPINSCWYLMLCHCMCWGLVLSQESQAIKEWRLAGKPRYCADGVVMR